VSFDFYVRSSLDAKPYAIIRLLSTQGAGWVSEEGHWVRTDDACRSSQFVQRFRDTPQTLYTQEFPSFINKTMFILGDSVGRQLWDQICAEIKAPKIVKTPEGVTPHVDYSEVSLCTQPELNFTVMAFHQYGQSERGLELSGKPADDQVRSRRLCQRYGPYYGGVLEKVLSRWTLRLPYQSHQLVEHHAEGLP
jgi:hypothetical protein